MDLRKIILSFLLMLPLLVRGQEYKVESFENVPSDLTARTESRVDNNGRKCGLIKVYVKDAITATGGPVVGDVVDRGMEKWVYVAHDAKKIQLLFKEHMPLYVTFDDYNYPTITGQMTYILKLKEVTDQTPLASTTYPQPEKPVEKKDQTEVTGMTPSEMFDKGVDADNRKDYAEAVRWYRKAADRGNAPAQNNLGLLYQYGYGVDQNYSEAVNWYRKAAEQGNAAAQSNLGLMYRNGYGVDQDYSEAVKWYRKGAEQGEAIAQCNLGWMYQFGYGVAKDDSEAVNWSRKAAEQGQAIAQSNLGWMYHFGYGVDQDYSEAVKWYRKAAEQGNAIAQSNLGHMYQNGYGVAKDYSEAVNWYRKAAEQGNAIAQCNLGQMYENGYGVAMNLSEARKWYEKAAAQGEEDANKRLKNL